MADEHALMIGGSFLSDNYTADCSCGWNGHPHDDEADAVDEWENHCDAVFMEATDG